MQVSSISSTNFGLRIDSDMQELLDKSRGAAKMKGQEEYDSFVIAEEKMKTLADENWELYLGSYGCCIQEVKLHTPHHGIWEILTLQGTNKVLTADNIKKDIMNTIRCAKTSERERYHS